MLFQGFCRFGEVAGVGMAVFALASQGADPPGIPTSVYGVIGSVAAVVLWWVDERRKRGTVAVQDAERKRFYESMKAGYEAAFGQQVATHQKVVAALVEQYDGTVKSYRDALDDCRGDYRRQADRLRREQASYEKTVQDFRDEVEELHRRVAALTPGGGNE